MSLNKYAVKIKNSVLCTAHYLGINIYNVKHDSFLYLLFSEIVRNNIYRPDDLVKTQKYLSAMTIANSDSIGTDSHHIVLRSNNKKDYVLTEKFVETFMSFITNIELCDDYVFAIKKEHKQSMVHAFKLFEHFAYDVKCKQRTMPFVHFCNLIEIDSTKFGYYKSKGTKLCSEMFGDIDYLMNMNGAISFNNVRSINRKIVSVYIRDEIINKMNTLNKRGSRPKWAQVEKVKYPIVNEFKPYVLVVDLNWHENTEYCVSIEMAAERGDETIYTDNIFNINSSILSTHGYKLKLRQNGVLKELSELGQLK